jgi:aminoglycoside phosphotransferase (APT) family kinase protein
VTETIVATAGEASQLEHGAAIVLRPLETFLDEVGLGAGELDVKPIGDGHSNLTFLLRRGESRFVLRRPPRGELAASANDVLRESRLLEHLAKTAVPVPAVLARCDDPACIGAPFFIMSHVPGTPINDGLPPSLDRPGAAERIVDDVVDALAALHAADLEQTGLATFGKPTGYLERQLRRFGSLLDANATRPLPDLHFTASWLSDNIPTSTDITFVHGDYRLGNLMFDGPLHLTAVLDWEMATVGDPLADLGYCTATWAAAEDEQNPMFSLSRLTSADGFPGRGDLVRRYSERTGRTTHSLAWYQVLALWKSAIFLEGSYRRFRSGASTDAFFASLDRGVPAIAATARRWIAQTETHGSIAEPSPPAR